MSNKSTIADQAEDQVRIWATAAGFVVNSAQRDRAGWDHFLELSEPRQTHPNPNFLNVPSRSLPARVQVKSTRTLRRAVPIALSNWQRAIEDPHPWFYLVLRYSTDGQRLLEVASIHLDRQLVEQVMEHVHSLPESQLRKLHRLRYSLRWSDNDLLGDPQSAGAQLRRHIEAAVPQDPLQYAVEKQKWSTNAGCTPTKEMHFTVVAPNQDELFQRLSRAAVGLEESIPVSGVRITRERFGRSVEDPTFPNGTSGNVQIGHGADDDHWILGVSDAVGGDELTLPVTVRFSAAILPGLPEKYWLARIATAFLDLIFEWTSGKVSISVRLPPAALPVNLSDLTLPLQLLTRLAQSQGGRSRLSLTKKTRRLPFNCLIPSIDLDEEIKRVADQTWLLSTALHLLHVESAPTLSIRAVETLAPMAQLIVAAHGLRQLVIRFETEIPADMPIPDKIALVTDAYLQIDDYRYIQLVVVRGTAELRDEGGTRWLAVTSDDLAAHSLHKIHRQDADGFPLQQKAEEIERELQSQGVGLVIAHSIPNSPRSDRSPSA